MSDFAVVVSRVEGMWEAALLPERLVDDFEGLLGALRQQVPGDGGVIGLVNVSDEFFVAVRMVGADPRVLLSDVTAAVAWDLAAQVVEYLGLERPGDEDLEDVWPAGDLSIFADLGLDEMELGALLSDLDAYADETLLLLAKRLGFADAYERVVEPVFH
ncbi:MAG TPA: tRNA adenosine deaminase-associated protein [Frankiaceae bacterium]|nr:tRNA adenosine deaminase-associated protein [Frankiaceae bacterium]